jgi:hypothetical protein
MKGAAIEAVRITGLTSDACTVDEDLGSGLIESVANGSTGVYTLQLSQPYPPKLALCIPYLTNPDGVTDLRFATYDQGGYDADAGTITIRISNDDDNGAPVLADPDSGAELHVLMIFGRYSTI